MKRRRLSCWNALVLCILMAITIWLMMFTLASLTAPLTFCASRELVCYKTECTFWGCSEIRVDLDSSSCERKENECVTTYG